MKKLSISLYIILAATLSACGDFEWFPKVPDSTAPNVTAYIENKQIFANRSTHVTTLPSTVTFYTDEAATIYYTTNNTDPTTSSASVGVSSSSGATGPSITLSGTILKFFGRDQAANSSAIQAGTIVSP